MKNLLLNISLLASILLTILSSSLSAQYVEITVKDFPGTNYAVYWTAPGPEDYYRQSVYSGEGYFKVDIEESGRVRSAKTFCLEPVEWSGSLNEKLEYTYVDGGTYYNSAYQSELINHPSQAPIDPSTFGIITSDEKKLIAKVWDNEPKIFDGGKHTVAMQMMIWELVCDQEFDMYSGNFSIDPYDMRGIKIYYSRMRQSSEVYYLINEWKRKVDEEEWISFAPLGIFRNDGKQDLISEIDVQTEFGISGISGNLPVEWLSVQADKIGDSNVQIDWSTSQEINNERFEIEKKINDSEYVTIATIQGQGTTDNVSTYTYTDRGIMGEYVYYRIKQIDLDGTYEYSKTLEVKNASINQFAEIYPNPAVNHLNIRTNLEGVHKYQVISQTGNMLSYGSFNNAFQEQAIDISNLNTGRYIIRVEMPDGTIVSEQIIRN